MTAVKVGDVERTIRQLDPSVAVVLVYGPDAGLVSERARRVAESRVADPRDPFQLIRLDGDAVADTPGRLVEEVSTFGMFAGPRVILVRATSRNLAPAVTACLDMQGAGTLVVVEAGNLTRASPLRSACEASRRSVAIPCFADEGRDLSTLVIDAMAQAGLTIHPDARDLLVDHVGGDRLATRSELAKLALYAHGRDVVTVEDVEAVVSDVSAHSTDAVLDHAFLGRIGELDGDLALMASRGLAPAAILVGGMRHGLTLLSSRSAIDAGQDTDAAVQAWRGLHFRRRELVKRQIRIWRDGDLRWAIAVLQAASLDTRRMASIAPAVTSTALLRIARRAAALSGR